MIPKVPPSPLKVRRVPKQFSWIDHRLVREYRIDHLTHTAMALYLFLVTVSDAKGLSFYGDASLMKRLSMSQLQLQEARNALINNSLVVYEQPIYQVVALDHPPLPDGDVVQGQPCDDPPEKIPASAETKGGDPTPIREILKMLRRNA